MVLDPRMKLSPIAEVPLKDSQRASRDRVLSSIERGDFTLEEVPCFCGTIGGEVIAERDRYSIPVTTLLCPTCGLLRSSPRFDAASNEKFYREEYRNLYSGHLSKDHLFEDQLTRGRDLMKLVPKLVGNIRTAFDVGCGVGGVPAAFQENGILVKGCDLDGPSVEYARQKGLEVIHGTVTDLLESHGEAADLVMLHHVAEHYLDLRTELEEVIAAVRPEGFLLLEVPGVQKITNDFYDWNLVNYLQNAHNYHFSQATMRFVLECLDLQVVKIDDLVFALCRKPKNWQPSGAHLVAPPKDEAVRIRTFLQETEWEWQKAMYTPEGGQLAQLWEPPAWKLGAPSTFNILAWPRYDDVQGVVALLRMAEPLIDNDDACLCVRFDPEIDPEPARAKMLLQAAFQRLYPGRRIKILLIDQPMSRLEWRQLGRAVKCIIWPVGPVDTLREEFYKTVCVERIRNAEELVDALRNAVQPRT